MKIGDKVKVKDEAKDLLPYTIPDDVEYIIVDIIENQRFPYVLKSDTFGQDWRQFFKEDELKLI